jgi:hypothetical protein
MNALEATQAGAEGTGIELGDKKDKEKKEGSGGSGGIDIGQIASVASKVLMKKSNPITFNASPFKNTDTEKTVEKKIVSHNGTAKDYIKTMMNKAATSGGYTGGGTFKNKAEKDWYDGQIKKRVDSGMSNEDAIQDYRNTFQIGTKKPDTPASSSANISLTPRKEEIKTDPTQTYNMSYASSVNANMSEGAQRRGTRRAERRANKDLDIYSGEKNSGFLGLGGKKNKGKLSANVIAAAEKTGLKSEKLKEMGLNVDDKGSITGDSDQNVTEQMRSRATNLSMNKYNQGLNEFSYKPGSSETGNESGEGYEVYDGPVGNINTSSNVDFSKFGKTDYAGDFKQKTDKLLQGMTSFNGPTKKGYKGKNATAFKYKSGRGAGY